LSRQTALDAINLRKTDRFAHTDYSLSYHVDLIKKKTGLEPSHPDAMRLFFDACGIDLLFNTNDGIKGNYWGNFGRVTNMGHAVYASDGSDMTDSAESPFKTAEEVWAFDPVSEYGLPDFGEQVAAYEQLLLRLRKSYPNQLIPGGYYKTIISGAIQSFGWEMLLIGASDMSKMEKVLDGFFRYTKFHMEAWAKTSVEVVIQHDDFVWTSGPFMHPEYYRKIIIPRFAELWKPLHAAGKKVLFISDGNYTEFAEDIAEAGADGFFFEPMNDFGYMAERFGQSHALVGSYLDCRKMTFGKWEQIKEDMDKTFETAKKCRGLIFAVGNHLPANIPEEIMERYFNYLMENWYL